MIVVFESKSKIEYEMMNKLLVLVYAITTKDSKMKRRLFKITFDIDVCANFNEKSNNIHITYITNELKYQMIVCV